MTDRVEGAYIQFDHDIREDCVEGILNAVRMIKGVAACETENFVVEPATWAARERVKAELYDVLQFVLQGLMGSRAYFVRDKERTQLALAKLQKMLRELDV